MRQIDYDNQTLKDAQAEVRRLFIVALYGFKSYYKTLTNEEYTKLKEEKQNILKAFFKQLATYKKLYAESIKQKD